MKKTRTSTAAPLPEKSMVDCASRYNAVADFFALEDAYAQERSGLDFFDNSRSGSRDRSSDEPASSGR